MTKEGPIHLKEIHELEFAVKRKQDKQESFPPLRGLNIAWSHLTNYWLLVSEPGKIRVRHGF